jgi:TRAP transporter TAXI family solute receptor
MRMGAPLTAWAAAAACCLSLVACQSAADVTRPQPTVVNVVESLPGSVFFDALHRELPSGMEIRPIANSDPPMGALEALQSGKADVAFSLVNLVYLAFAGHLDRHERFDRLRAIAALGIVPVHLVVRGDAPIFHVSDLKGHAVAVEVPYGVGVPNHPALLLSQSILAAYGIDPASVGSSRSTEAAFGDLRSGKLDAVFTMGLYPTAPVGAALESGARLVPIDGPPVERLRDRDRFLESVMIPAGIYPGQERGVPTIGLQNLVICRRDLDPHVVYQLTGMLLNSAPRLAEVIPSFRFVDLSKADVTSIPLHEGAARFYRERELFP